MTFRIKSLVTSIFVIFGLAFSLNIQNANAAFGNLTLCKDSPAFEKRLNVSGVYTFADLIALTDEKIAELEAQYSIKTSLEVWHNLIEEAKTLA